MTESSATPQPRPRVFLESRYVKFVRDVSQTVFFCPECKGHRRKRVDCARCEGFGRLTKDSVEELLARRLLPAFKAKRGKFHGAGREDLDVRMLGRGRPFVFELIGVRRLDPDLEELVDGLHARHGERMRLTEPLRVVERARVAAIKDAHWDKRYGLEVALDGESAAAALASAAALVGRRFELVQRTPQRVAHRRADLERERWVVVESVEPLADDAVALTICCQHGTYVKEWVSGDDGRTTPSFAGAVGCAASCRVLDVLEILDA